MINFLSETVSKNADISSSSLAQKIVEKAKSCEEFEQAMDDISAVVLYFREPRKSLIFTGPPYHREKDNEYAITFDNFVGKKAICGGTTANLISRELSRSWEICLLSAIWTVSIW